MRPLASQVSGQASMFVKGSVALNPAPAATLDQGSCRRRSRGMVLHAGLVARCGLAGGVVGGGIVPPENWSAPRVGSTPPSE